MWPFKKKKVVPIPRYETGDKVYVAAPQSGCSMSSPEGGYFTEQYLLGVVETAPKYATHTNSYSYLVRVEGTDLILERSEWWVWFRTK